MNEPVIHRKKKRVEVFVKELNPPPVVAKVKKVKQPKVKKVKTPPPPPRVRGLPTPPHPDGTREERIKLFLKSLQQDLLLFQQIVPLKIKIHKDLAERYPEIKKHIICGALHHYTQDVRYFQVLKVGAQRYDLDMQPVAEVTEEHAALAKRQLLMKLKRLIKPRS